MPHRQAVRPSRSRSAVALALLALLSVPALALEQRSFDQNFPVIDGSSLRLANLAGTVELVAATDGVVRVEVTAHGETRALVDGLAWVETTDSKGRREWALSYPVDDYRAFHYPGADDDHESWDGGFFGRLLTAMFGNHISTNRDYLGQRVRIVGRASRDAPTLYADLRIAVPSSGALAVRTLVGPMRAGELAGDLTLDTSSGDVSVAAFDGKLLVDTGSGSVRLGRTRGDIVVDTGSGGIEIASLEGKGRLDTGSGGVRVDAVQASSLLVDTGSGSVTIRNGAVDDLVADTGSGSVKVLGVEIGTFRGDTGSGGVTLESSLASARQVDIDTGSGRITILAGPTADFDLHASLGSGGLDVGYSDAQLRRDGREVVGATRGTGRTKIRVDTGSGGASIRPRG